MYDGHPFRTSEGGRLSMRQLRRLGFLRMLLVLGAVVAMLAAPFADGDVHLHDWRLLPSVVAPAAMMVLVFVILLDIIMARVFMADAGPQERSRLAFAIIVEAGVLIAMMAAWTPFFLRIFVDPA
jgi:hypothetical protein